MKLRILQIGRTKEVDGKVELLIPGDMPPDCVVLFMDEESLDILKEELE